MQAEECSKRKLKFLEKSLELEKEKLLGQVIEERNKATLVELEHKHVENTEKRIQEHPTSITLTFKINV